MAKVRAVETIQSVSEMNRYHSAYERELLTEIMRLKDELKKKDAIIETERARANSWENLYGKLNEKYLLAIHAKYCSQKTNAFLDHPTLFSDNEIDELTLEVSENEIIVSEHTRKTSPVKKQELDYSGLQRITVPVDIPEEMRICDICGGKRKIKDYIYKEELVCIPASLFVREYKIPVLECEQCQEHNEEGKSTYITVDCHPLIKGSKASSELIAYIIDEKYNKGVPLYAIEKHMLGQHVVLPRQNMTNWLHKVAHEYLQPLYNLMKEDLLKSHVISADETVTQVLHEDGRLAASTSYMWVYHSNAYEKPIVLYDYAPTRSGDVPKKFLESYQGVLCSDAYSGYNKVDNVVRSLCNVHAIRRFKEALQLLPKKTKNRNTSLEAQAVEKYQKIFHVEHEIQYQADSMGLSGEERYEMVRNERQKRIKPLIEAFSSWLVEINGEAKGKHHLADAITYFMNNKEGLCYFLENGQVPLDNTICERAIRPFCVIRGRCKFHVSPKGATASAIIYSLMITCQENGITPYTYFFYILDKLRTVDKQNTEELRKLLPYSSELPQCMEQLSVGKAKQKLRELEKEASM